MQEQRRRESRKKILAFTPVYALNPKTLLGYLGDLTVHGAMIVGETSVEADRLVKLLIEFPSGLPEVGNSPFTIAARVARFAYDKSPHYFIIGVEFTEVSPQQQTVIEAILRRYEFQQELP